MKANFRKLGYPMGHAFHVREDVRDYFDDKWHFHDMLELVYIKRGSGIMYIGDSIESFNDGQVVLVGDKLPHVWKSNDQDRKIRKSSKCIAVVVQFPKDFLGDRFLDLSEVKPLSSLFDLATRGVLFEEAAKKELGQKMSDLPRLNGMERLIRFLDILHFAAQSKNYRLLASPHFIESIKNMDNRIKDVFGYVMENYQRPITLSKVASIAHMNKTAFCRYFKLTTKKTFFHFLNEVRIGHACEQLREANISINEVAYRCGFSSASYFSVQFKSIKNCSPSEYKIANRALHSLN